MGIRQLRGLWPAALMSVALLALGAYLWFWTSSSKLYSETLLIRDLVWLDGWGLLFVFTVAFLWRLPVRRQLIGWLIVAALAVWGVIMIRLVLDGTPFGISGYWGDQKFRTAMIEKFLTWWVPIDFYYKDLPPFYPPLLYYLLALLARVLGFEAYQMIKVGTYAIYALGPVAVYLMWRKLVSPVQAAVVTLVSFLFLSAGKPFALLAPHAMVGNILFLPWWLYYIEGVNAKEGTWRHCAAGGVIGGLIFMTYFYGFFIGLFLIVLRAVCARLRVLRYFGSIRLAPALKVLGIAAVVSMPYWLPLALSVLRRGGDAATGWHHIESTGTLFAFMSLSIPSLLYLAGLLYAVRRVHAPLYRALTVFVGGMMGYYLVGALLGAVDRPINLIKANEIFSFLAGPFIALPAVALLRAKRGSRIGRGFEALAIIVLLVLVHQANSTAKHSQVEQAKKTNLPDWHLDQEEMGQRTGSVFLSAYEEFPSFYPVFLFVAPNHHYSHPAGLYTERYRFLYELQWVSDPFLFNTALRENRFHRVDYVHLRKKDDRLNMSMVLDNYPNRYTVRELTFDPGAFAEKSLLVPLETEGFFAVGQPPTVFESARFGFAGKGGVDSLLFLARWQAVREHLTDTGRQVTDKYLGADWSKWLSFRGKVDFDGALELLGATAVAVGSDLHLYLTVHVRDLPTHNYKVFVHAYKSDGSFDNLDFLPTPRVSEWQDEELHVIHRVIPGWTRYKAMRLGFYYEGKRLGQGILWNLAREP